MSSPALSKFRIIYSPASKNYQVEEGYDAGYGIEEWYRRGEPCWTKWGAKLLLRHFVKKELTFREKAAMKPVVIEEVEV